MSNLALDAVAIEKRYGDHLALAGIDLQVEEGQIVALLGPNGAGKTTFVSIVAGVLAPSAGSVRVFGHSVASEPRTTRRLVGWAPQELGIYPVLTARENLRVFGSIARLGKRELDEVTEELAEALDLAPLLDKPARFMSGGEQRRLHTAIALVHRPRLLLLDEPTVGVDVETRGALLEFVKRRARDGAAIVYSTHYLGEVESLDAAVTIIDRGQIVAAGSVADLVAEHGGSALELTFEGQPPDLGLDVDVQYVDNVVRIPSSHPAQLAASILGSLGTGAGVVSVDLVRPSLESAFVALTGRRFEEDSGAAPDVVASGD